MRGVTVANVEDYETSQNHALSTLAFLEQAQKLDHIRIYQFAPHCRFVFQSVLLVIRVVDSVTRGHCLHFLQYHRSELTRSLVHHSETSLTYFFSDCYVAQKFFGITNWLTKKKIKRKKASKKCKKTTGQKKSKKKIQKKISQDRRCMQGYATYHFCSTIYL